VFVCHASKKESVSVLLHAGEFRHTVTKIEESVNFEAVHQP